MATAGDTELRTYYEAVLKMLERVTREERSGRGANHGVRTSDVVQEVFLRIRPQLRRQESLESLVPLAATVARRWLIDASRKRRVDSVPIDLLEGAAHSLRRTGIEPLDLQGLLADMTEIERTIIDLRVFAGLEQAEIIAVTGQTEYAVRKALKRAKRDLDRLRGSDT